MSFDKKKKERNLHPSIGAAEMQITDKNVREKFIDSEVVDTLIKIGNLIVNEKYFKFNKLIKQI